MQRYVNGNKCRKLKSLSLSLLFKTLLFASRSPEKERTKYHASANTRIWKISTRKWEEDKRGE